MKNLTAKLMASNERDIETSLALIETTLLTIQNMLGLYPAVRITFQYGDAIETLTYDWDGKAFTA